jgi:hypothetical protein
MTSCVEQANGTPLYAVARAGAAPPNAATESAPASAAAIANAGYFMVQIMPTVLAKPLSMHLAKSYCDARTTVLPCMVTAPMLANALPVITLPVAKLMD